MPTEHALRLYKRFGPLRYEDASYGNSSRALAEALSGPTDALNDFVRAGANHVPWQPAVDPDESLELGHSWALRWLSSIVGAGVTAPRLFEAAHNLIRNPGAEVDLTNWGALNATLARVTTDQRTGAGAYQLTSSAAGLYYMGPQTGATTHQYLVKPGQAYSMGAYIKAANPGSVRDVRMSLSWNLSDNTTLSVNAAPTPSTSSAYVRLGLENAVAPSNALSVSVFIQVLAAAGAGEITLVDDIMLVPAATLPAYFDGNTPSDSLNAYSWVNAANGSYSIHRRMQTEDEWANEARSIILDRPLWRRGQPLYIRQKILRTLDHSADLSHVVILPRTAGPWTDNIIISAARCPNQTRTTAATLTEKPAMRSWTIVYTDSPVINQGTDAINVATGVIDTATLADIT